MDVVSRIVFPADWTNYLLVAVIGLVAIGLVVRWVRRHPGMIATQWVRLFLAVALASVITYVLLIVGGMVLFLTLTGGD